MLPSASPQHLMSIILVDKIGEENISTFKVVCEAHVGTDVDVGVNVYVVVAVLSKAGDHVPVMPLFDVVGNALKLSPEQIALTAVKLGVMFGLTVMVSVVVVAH